MLKTLHIENIAVIERADVEFSAGLSVLTGETGAGKSIIIDSLNAVLGNRVSRELVRSGAERASVTASFESAQAERWCADNEIDADDGEIMGIRHRELPIEGIQYHPESMLTESGMAQLENFLRIVEARKVAAR